MRRFGLTALFMGLAGCAGFDDYAYFGEYGYVYERPYVHGWHASPCGCGASQPHAYAPSSASGPAASSSSGGVIPASGAVSQSTGGVIPASATLPQSAEPELLGR